MTNAFTINGENILTKFNITNCDELKQLFPNGKIIIPDNVVEIGVNAFRGVIDSLLPDFIHTIEFTKNSKCLCIREKGFKYLKYVKKIILPPKLEKIENEAFNCCNNIERIDFPKTIKEIGYHAFHKCERLIVLNFSQVLNIPKFGMEAFLHIHRRSKILVNWKWFGYDRKKYARLFINAGWDAGINTKTRIY